VFDLVTGDAYDVTEIELSVWLCEYGGHLSTFKQIHVRSDYSVIPALFIIQSNPKWIKLTMFTSEIMLITSVGGNTLQVKRVT